MIKHSFSIVNQTTNENNDRIVSQFVDKLNLVDQKQAFLTEVNSLDKKLYSYYAGQNYLSSPVFQELYKCIPKQAVKVNIPMQNSLVDSMLRSTLGCQEKLASAYLQTLDVTKQIEEDQKNKRIDMARKVFASSNSCNDFMANAKGFMNPTKFAQQRPVIDNQHDSYLKTHLTFLNKPKAKTSHYYTKFADTVTSKIVEMGGIEDTISPIEQSLKTNEIRNLKKREKVEGEVQTKQRRLSPSPSRSNLKNEKLAQNWLNESKMMRQTLLAKLITS